MPDFYPQEKGVIKRDRTGEARDILAKELMYESLGLIPFAGMIGKLGKGMKPFAEYVSQIRPKWRGVYQSSWDPPMSLRDIHKAEIALGGKRTTKKQAAESLKKESAKFKKDLLSGKVDALGRKETEFGRSHRSKYGPRHTDAGIESYMGNPGIAASTYGGVMNLKDWTPTAVARFKRDIKRDDEIYDRFVKGFKDILSAKHLPSHNDRLARAKRQLREAGVVSQLSSRSDLKNKVVQEAFLKPAAKQARSELAKQFPKVFR